MNLTDNRKWIKISPYERFFDFISPDVDRFGILLEQIKKLNLNSLVVTIDGNRHIFIFPAGINLKLSSGNKFPYRGENPVILTAHYDRVPDSPGANDNSAAVFMLLRAALLLIKQRQKRWIIIFTDKEELQKGEKIKDQGSFGLTKKLTALGLGNAQIFNFDACGTGDTFIFSSTVDYLFKKNIITDLRNKALITAKNLNLKKLMLAPVPFSDDAGFLRGGIPAQTITILPTEEANAFALQLKTHPNFADQIILSSIKNSMYRQFIPHTWCYLNSPSDTYLLLTPEHYENIVRFAVELCR